MTTDTTSVAPDAEERELIRNILQGDVDRFKVVVERYQDYVAGVCVRHVPFEEVEETVHETFVRAYISLKTWRGDGTLKSWLAGVCVRTCRDVLRRLGKREPALGDPAGPELQWAPILAAAARREFADRTEREETVRLLDAALAQLSTNDRMVLALVHLEGRSIAETAEILGISRANVKVRGFRARKRLRSLLESMAEEKNEKANAGHDGSGPDAGQGPPLQDRR